MLGLYLLVLVIWFCSFIALLMLYYPVFIKLKTHTINEKASFLHFVFGMLDNKQFVQLLKDQIPKYLLDTRIFFGPPLIALIFSLILDKFYEINYIVCGLISTIPQMFVMLSLALYYKNRPIIE